MKISKTHQRFADWLNNQRALDCPEEFFGPNWKEVLNFWFFIDTLSSEQFEIAQDRFWNLDDADIDSARNLAANAATDTIMCRSITYVAFMAAPRLAGGNATRELIGAHKILEKGKPLTFVPLFLEL
jgi:hypothetical protein